MEDFKNATIDSSVSLVAVLVRLDLGVVHFISLRSNTHHTVSLQNVPVHPHSHETASVWDYADHDDFFEKSPLTESSYSVSVFYSGSRWYGSTLPPETFSKDFHSYWDEALSPRSFFIVSQRTASVTPTDIDFYEMRNRQKWGGHNEPFGGEFPSY